MIYRIRRGDEDLGAATVEELRQRRAAGALAGTEVVQGEGAAEWQPLDAVLADAEPPLLPPLITPPPPARPRRALWYALAVAGTVVGCAFAGASYLFYRQSAASAASQATQLAPGVAEASEPIPAGAKPTVRDTEARMNLFRRRQWLDGYRQRSPRLASEDAANEKFIRVALARNDGGPEAGDPLQLDIDALRIAQDPAEKDPLIMAFAASYIVNWYRRVELYERAVALFPAAHHRGYPQLYAEVMLMGESKYPYDKLGPLNGQAVKSFERCFADGSFQPADQQEIAQILIVTWGQTFFANNQNELCEVVRRAGPKYGWLALVLTGQAKINAAWAARGEGYISTVSASGYQAFQQDLAEAEVSLTEAWKLHPDFPLAAAVGVSAALGDGAAKARMWFDRAVAAQIDEPVAWQHLRWALRARWYGGPAAEIALARAALNTGRFDSEAPHEVFSCVEDLESDVGHAPGRHLYGRRDVWPLLQGMYEGYIAEPSKAKDRDGWRSSYAVVAYFAGHYDVAAQQLAKIGWELPEGQLTSWGADLSVMPLEVAARTSPAAREIEAAEADRAAGRRADALRKFRLLAAAKAGDERTQEFIRFRITHLTEEQHVEDGRWLSLIPGGDRDRDWVFALGRAHRTAAGDLEVEYGPNGHMLYPKIEVGSDFEVRGSFEVVRSTNTNFQAGIVIGLPDFERDLNGTRWWGFRLKRHDEEGDIVCFGQGWTLQEVRERVPLNATRNTFDLVVSENHFTATVNGERVFTNIATPSWLRLPENGYFVGLGAFSDSADAVVRYHNVEVRKLSLNESALDAGNPVGPVADADEDAPEKPAAKVPAAAPVHPDLPMAGQIAADSLELNQAVDRVKEIVNRPAPYVTPKEGMRIGWWNGSWFHPGAEVPDYLNVDISKTRENPYRDYDYVATNLHPDMAFSSQDLEFNSMTKYYYTDRSLPKRKLTRAEMAEVNRLYRVIGRCQADLARLQAK